jgi:hypothetical protein
MPRLTKEAWADLRAEWETGTQATELGKKYGCSRRMISRRAHDEHWIRPEGVKAEVARRAKEKASKAPPHDPDRLEAAIEAKADKTVEVIHRHREEAQAVRGLMYNGIRQAKEAKSLLEKQVAFETLKAAKITSETLRNLHVVERKAWNLDGENEDDAVEIIIQRSYGL